MTSQKSVNAVLKISAPRKIRSAVWRRASKGTGGASIRCVIQLRWSPRPRDQPDRVVELAAIEHSRVLGRVIRQVASGRGPELQRPPRLSRLGDLLELQPRHAAGRI